MFDELRKKLYFAKFNILGAKASNEGKIQEFEEEIFKKMDNTIIACFPVSFFIKHSKHMFGLGTCYDRSLYMFLALDDAILVRGNNKDLEYNYGKGHGGHGWIEIGDYVYDPSIMLKFDKETYYKLYGCSDVYKIDKKSYLEKYQEFVDSVVSTDFSEFRPGGKRRLELGILVFQIRELASMVDDDEFKKDLADYLELIEYDEDQIQKEREEVVKNLLRTEGALDIISGSYQKLS